MHREPTYPADPPTAAKVSPAPLFTSQPRLTLQRVYWFFFLFLIIKITFFRPALSDNVLMHPLPPRAAFYAPGPWELRSEAELSISRQCKLDIIIELSHANQQQRNSILKSYNGTRFLRAPSLTHAHARQRNAVQCTPTHSSVLPKHSRNCEFITGEYG